MAMADDPYGAHALHTQYREKEGEGGWRDGESGAHTCTHAHLHSPHSCMVILLAIAESQEGKEEGKEEGRAGRLGEPTHIARNTGLHRGQCAVCK